MGLLSVLFIQFTWLLNQHSDLFPLNWKCSVRNLDSATSCFLLCCNCGVASLFLCTGNGTMSRRRISVKELGQPDHQGWLYRKKESKGFLGIKWKKYWFVLKKTSLYWYNNQLVSKAAFYRPIYDVDMFSQSLRHSYETAVIVHHCSLCFSLRIRSLLHDLKLSVAQKIQICSFSITVRRCD